jgi:hypothetical protein
MASEKSSDSLSESSTDHLEAENSLVSATDDSKNSHKQIETHIRFASLKREVLGTSLSHSQGVDDLKKESMGIGCPMTATDRTINVAYARGQTQSIQAGIPSRDHDSNNIT